MATDSTVWGVVRGLLRRNLMDGENSRLQMSTNGAALTASALPERTEITRLGRSWWATNVTARAALTAAPAGTSGFGIFNPAFSQDCYVIDSVAIVESVVDTTQQNQMTVWASCSRKYADPGASGSITIGSFSGIHQYTGVACLDQGYPVATADRQWVVIGTSSSSAAAVAGGAWRTTDIDLKGAFVVVPGGAFHLQATKVAATASQLFYFIRWHEMPLQYV